MSFALSPPIMPPAATVALKAAGNDRRGASFLVTIDASHTTVICDVSQLPATQALGPLGSIYINNSENLFDAFIRFQDTNAVVVVPAGNAIWILALTGERKFTVFSFVAAQTNIEVQAVDFIVAPSGSTEVNATVVGTVTAVPTHGTPADQTQAAIPATINTLLLAANAARLYMLLQMPQGSGGWINFTGAAASVAGVGCLYMQAGEKFQSQQYVPTGAVHVFLDSGGVVPVLEG